MVIKVRRKVGSLAEDMKETKTESLGEQRTEGSIATLDPRHHACKPASISDSSCPNTYMKYTEVYGKKSHNWNLTC